jgi:hypothetical protein
MGNGGGSQVVLTGFGIPFDDGMLGLAIGKMLPKEHLGEGTLPMVQAAMGALSILSALALGFLINSAKVKFETASVQIEQFASDLAINTTLSAFRGRAFIIVSMTMRRPF